MTSYSSIRAVGNKEVKPETVGLLPTLLEKENSGSLTRDELESEAEVLLYDYVLEHWTSEVLDCLNLVTTPNLVRKRYTLFLLFEAVITGYTPVEYFKRYRPEQARFFRLHRRWHLDDEQYRLAYNRLVGTPQEPGIAWRLRLLELNDFQHDATNRVLEAFFLAQYHSVDAIVALVEALQATTKQGTPSHLVRVTAADKLLRVTLPTPLSQKPEDSAENRPGSGVHLFLPDNGRTQPEELVEEEVGDEPYS